MRNSNILWQPMCCTMSIPFGLSSLTAGIGESFRFVVTKGSSDDLFWRSITPHIGEVYGRIEISSGLTATNGVFFLRFENGDAREIFTQLSGIDIHMYNEPG